MKILVRVKVGFWTRRCDLKFRTSGKPSKPPVFTTQATQRKSLKLLAKRTAPKEEDEERTTRRPPESVSKEAKILMKRNLRNTRMIDIRCRASNTDMAFKNDVMVVGSITVSMSIAV